MVLSNTTQLDGRYLVQSVLGEAGPFDVTYLAWDVRTECEVVIREYYPLSLTRRSRNGVSLEVHNARLFEFGLAAYHREAELLNEFEHPNVVMCTGHFQENGTLYRVSSHVSGVSLAAYMKQLAAPLSEEEAMAIMEPLLDGLGAAHARQLYHGSLSPKSVFINEAGRPVLLNFQMARTRLAQYCGAREDVLIPGFFPAEKLQAEDFAAWDIYGFGALLYYMLVGKALPTANEKADHYHIRQAIKHSNMLSPSIRRLLLDALAFDPSERAQPVSEYRKRLRQTVSLPSPDERYAEKDSPVEIGYTNISKGSDEIPADREILLTEHSKHAISGKGQRQASRNGPSNHRDSRGSELDMKTRPSATHQSGQDVPVQRPDYLPKRARGEEPELEDILAEVVRRQQQFIMVIFAVMLLILGFFGLIYLGPRFMGDQSNAMITATNPGEPLSNQQSANTTAGPETSNNDVSEPSPEPGSSEQNADQEVEQQLQIAENREPEAESRSESNQTASAGNRQDTRRDYSDRAGEDRSEEDVEEAPAVIDPSSVQEEEENLESNRSDTAGAASEETEDAPSNPASAREAAIAMANERQFRYLLGQGDALFEQNQIREALTTYESALDYRPDDADLKNRIEDLRRTLREEERAIAVAESLRVRISKVTDANGIFVAPDTAPVLLNEEEISRQVVYPSNAKRAEIQGRIIVRMMVNESGRAENPQIVKGIGFGCDEEAIRVLAEARFKPATFNQDPVKAWFMYSLVFSLD